MNQIGFRDLDAMILGKPAAEPPPPAIPLPAPQPLPRAEAPAAAPATGGVFAADAPQGQDALARGAAIGRLAELAAHARSETPLCIGLLGPAGSGKSFALRQLTAATAALSAAAAKTERSPFLTNILVRPVDAATLEGDPATALAGELYEALAAAHPELAREAAHAVRDPHVAVREATERHDLVRRQLDSERRTLEEADSRRARLVETILYETPGAQVESYARANRGRIETALARFGIRGDQMRTYKDLVRMTGESGAGGRIAMTLRSFWAFKGQTKLIVTAILLVLVGIGLGVATDTKARWIGWVRSTNPSMGSAANWMQAHIGLLASLQEIAWIGAAVALLANVWRASRFLQPIFRGATLLKGDLAQRRRDLDTALAHQTRRVDGLTSDAETAGRRVAEAQRRADAAGPALAFAEPSPFAAPTGRGQAQRFFDVVADLAAKAGAPQRIVIALDNLDGIAPVRAQEIMAAAHRLLRPSFLLIAATDPHRLGQSADELEKWIQVPFCLDVAAAPEGHAGLVRALLSAPKPAVVPVVNAKSSALDQPLSEAEAGVLTSLASLAARAGGSPRAIKRFVNLYRLARIDAGAHRGATALMLALNAGADPARGAMKERLAGQPDDAPFDLAGTLPAGGHARADEIAAQIVALDGAPLTVGALRAAAATAAPFTVSRAD